MHLRQLEGVLFVNRRYTKRVRFLSKMVCKRIRGGGGAEVGGPSSYNTLLSAPLAHYGPQQEAVCSFLLAIVTFYAFCLFSYSIGMLPFSLHLSPLSALQPLQVRSILT